MKLLKNCIVCDGTEHRLVYPSTYRGGVAEAHDYFLADRKASAHGDIRACCGCGFVFTSPQFDAADYDRIYSRIGSAKAPGDTASGPGDVATRARFARLRQAVARHTDLSQPFVDFGCGNGDFLREAGSPSGCGFEIGAPGRRSGPAASKIISGSWPELAGSAELPWGSQATVTAFDVFEHLAELERDIRLIRRVLRADGHLFVTVPDVASLVARASGGRWNMLLLEHLWYFSAATLDRLLLKHGFAAIEHRSVPYDASLGHIAKRLGESGSLRLPTLPAWLGDRVVPAPAGVLFAAYRCNRRD